tara:strand:+ start:204 stop:734 length:531 start_codon:yes stop_codon:yes gene_type:complete
MSELRTNRIIPRDGLPSGSVGGIIQIKSKHITDYFTTNSGTYVDVTGHSISITPTRADSKILIQYWINWYCNNGNDTAVTLRLLRNGTVIGSDSGNPMNDDRMGMITMYMSQQTHHSVSGFNYLDSPATTSALTYKTQVHCDSTSFTGGNIWGVNRFPALDDYRGSSSITAYEVSG